MLLPAAPPCRLIAAAFSRLAREVVGILVFEKKTCPVLSCRKTERDLRRCLFVTSASSAVPTPRSRAGKCIMPRRAQTCVCCTLLQCNPCCACTRYQIDAVDLEARRPGPYVHLFQVPHVCASVSKRCLRAGLDRFCAVSKRCRKSDLLPAFPPRRSCCRRPREARCPETRACWISQRGGRTVECSKRWHTSSGN